MFQRFVIVSRPEHPLERAGYGVGYLLGRAIFANASAFTLAAAGMAAGALLNVAALGPAILLFVVALVALVYTLGARRNWLAPLAVPIIVYGAAVDLDGASRFQLFLIVWGWLAASGWIVDLHRKHSPGASPRESPSEDAPPQTVLARWSGDGCTYVASVSDRRGDTVLAHFAPGSSVWIHRLQVAADDLRAGDWVWAPSPRRGWFAAQVMERRGLDVRLREPSGAERFSKVFGLRVVRASASSAGGIS